MPAKHKSKKALDKCVIEFGCAVTAAFHGGWVARKGKESIYSVFVEVAPQVRVIRYFGHQAISVASMISTTGPSAGAPRARESPARASSHLRGRGSVRMLRRAPAMQKVPHLELRLQQDPPVLGARLRHHPHSPQDLHGVRAGRERERQGETEGEGERAERTCKGQRITG
jgi:hypothetical protein